jgi:hypothetical protein
MERQSIKVKSIVPHWRQFATVDHHCSWLSAGAAQKFTIFAVDRPETFSISWPRLKRQ